MESSFICGKSGRFRTMWSMHILNVMPLQCVVSNGIVRIDPV